MNLCLIITCPCAHIVATSISCTSHLNREGNGFTDSWANGNHIVAAFHHTKQMESRQCWGRWLPVNEQKMFFLHIFLVPFFGTVLVPETRLYILDLIKFTFRKQPQIRNASHGFFCTCFQFADARVLAVACLFSSQTGP